MSEPNLIPIVTAAVSVATAIASVAGLGWWLSGRFRESDDKQRELLDRHEDRDQERHEENLDRFKIIAVALAKLGYKNGSP